MKNILLLILSMIPGFLIAEQSWSDWGFDAAKVAVGQGLQAITYASSMGLKVVSAVHTADSADVTIAAVPLLYGRMMYKMGKSFDFKQAARSFYAYPTFKVHAFQALKLCKPVPAAVAIGFVHHALTTHTPMKWADKQKTKS